MVSRIFAACGLSLLAAVALARGVSPYMPLGLSPEIERQIERGLILANRPVLTRPIAAASVLEALPQICEADRALCAEIRSYLSGFMRTAASNHASLSLSVASDDEVALPNRHGMKAASEYEFSFSGYWQPSDYFLMSGGFIAYDDETIPTGSMLSTGFEYAQLDVGFRDHWLSPMQSSSMLISSQSQTMPSVTLSNYTPLTRWNFRYELFLAEMSFSDRIRYQDGFTSGNPDLLGLHVSIEPFPGWSIGLNRIMQFGGGQRGGNSLSDIFDAFFDPSGKDNVGGDLSQDEEFGNQVASITTTFLVPAAKPFAVYFEYAGEDTSTLSNFRLGNVALSGGIRFPNLADRIDLTFEVSEWQNAWYTHGIYTDGLRHEGNVIGHWGGDWRTLNDGVGARSLMTRIGLQIEDGGWIETTLRTVENESYSPTSYERGYLLDVNYSRSWRQFNVGAELSVGDDVFGNSFSRLSGFIRF